MDKNIVLSTHELAVGYNTKSILSNVELAIPQNTVVAILGLNGTGKSTLLRTLGKLQPQLEGEVNVAGKEIHSFSSTAFSNQVAIVLPGRGDVVQALFVHELFSTTCIAVNNGMGKLTPEDVKVMEDVIDVLKIKHLVNKRIYQLSDGEAQLVFIARALMQQTPIILMDEPTSYLDVIHKMEIFTLIRSLTSQNKTILFTSHELDIALQIADYCLLIGDEGKHYFGEKMALVKNGKVPEFFNSDFLVFDEYHQRFSLKLDI